MASSSSSFTFLLFATFGRSDAFVVDPDDTLFATEGGAERFFETTLCLLVRVDDMSHAESFFCCAIFVVVYLLYANDDSLGSHPSHLPLHEI